MKNLIIVLALLTVVIFAFKNPKVKFNTHPEEGIKFYNGTWDEALQIAKKENKLIFLDIYATWCGPCKQLKKYSFSDAEVGKFYNHNFVNVTLDGEKGDGAKLAQKYGISGYPSLLFINGNGKIVGQTIGFHQPHQLLELGQKFIKN